mgnify:CR=1 FL=1
MTNIYNIMVAFAEIFFSIVVVVDIGTIIHDKKKGRL